MKFLIYLAVGTLTFVLIWNHSNVVQVTMDRDCGRKRSQNATDIEFT